MARALIWAAVAAVIAVPIFLAAASPLLAWRDPIYIIAGFAGIVGMALMVLQPLLVGGHLPGIAAMRGRRVHRAIGGLLVLSVVLHVLGLWITSPPDVVDALLLVSPTPFSVWGVIAMWAVFVTAALASVRKRLGLRTWRAAHTFLALVIIGGTVTHAVLIEGTMELASKIVLSAAILVVTAKVVFDLRAWSVRSARR